ncbi:MAG: NPCBM/NEW2 domain-containing protein, partial [Pseudomonadales bacterium]
MRKSQAKIISFFAGLIASACACAQFNYEVYDGTFNQLPDFSTLTPEETGTSNIIDVSVTSQTETFALVFTHNVQISIADQYDFSATSDDGSRVYIDGALVVDNDGLHGSVQQTGPIYLTPGSYSFRVEFFERYGGQVLEVGYRTGAGVFQPIPADGVLTSSLSGVLYGQWGPVIAWPHIAISAANLPDGRVLSWSSTETNAFPSGGAEFTHASVFDPQTLAFTNVDNNFHDMFCAGISTLENGVILASGGNPYDRRTTSFDPATLTWTARADMNDQRWYGTNITMPNGQVFSTFAKQAGNRSEMYNPANDSWTATANANMQTLVDEQNAINNTSNPTGAFSLEWWAHLAVAPQGDVFQGGPTQTWHRFDPIGGAANVSLGQPIGDTARMYGNAVTYDAGKVMLIGGGDRRADPPTSINNVYLVDLNGPAPVITAGAPMNYPRALSNSVTLPNGEVLVVGGNTVAKIFSDQGSVLPAEIYTPSTDSWRIVNSIAIPRNYHSTALLLKDGRVLSAGGGACGNGCSANHLDGQIFAPPYLFNPDNTPAPRPILSNVPPQAEAGDQVTVTASPDTISFSLVRLSGTTHHLNTDQRFLPVNSVNNGDGTFDLTLPANPNVLIVGNYWLFALNANGTPSIGENLQVIRDEISIPPSFNGAVYVSDLPWASESNGYGPAERDMSNGNTAPGDGDTIALNGLTYAKGIGGHSYSEIDIDLAGQYLSFFADIGLDDSRDGLCGNIRFAVDVDGNNQFTSGGFIDTTPTESIAVDVTGAATLTLKIEDNNNDSCGDHGNWANAQLTPLQQPGFRYYRFTPVKLRDDATADSVQIAELSFLHDGNRVFSTGQISPGGNNPAGTEAAKADDNNTGTKWRDYNKGALVYDFGVNTILDSYEFTTANDAVERDPVRWILEASKDGNSWVIIDDQSTADFATPTARGTSITPVDFVLPGVIVALPEPPRNSSSLLVRQDNGNDRIWNVNPDNDSVTVADDQGTVVAEIPVGDKPWAIASRPGANQVFVSNKGDATLSIINTGTLTVEQTINLPYASEPHGIVFDSAGSEYFIVLEAKAKLERRNAGSHAVTGSLDLNGLPRHLSMSFDDSRILVSNFITPPMPGEHTASVNTAAATAEIFAVNPVSMTLANTIALTHDNRSQSESQGPGMPNYLGAPVVSFDDVYAYVPSKKDNIDSGPTRMKAGMTFDSTVRANTSRISLATETEDTSLRIDHDNSSVATHAALTGNNRYVLVTLETSRELAVFDTVNGFELMRLPTGLAPQSVALSTDGSIAYVHNFMDRSISRFDLTQMLETDLPASNILASINTVSTETLAPDVLLGKQLFYDAADDRLSLDNYMSCAACHKEGKHDGRTWDLGGMGEGLRRTISLLGRGTGHGRQHWTGNFDEVQDFENQIRILNLGTGLMNQADYDATVDTLGPTKAGLSADLDALAAYVDSLTVVPPSPFRPSAAAMYTAAQNGKSLFVSKGCNSCHTPATTTDSQGALLHDIGTIDSDSGQRLGATLTGFDTPAILAAWAKPPYLHDGAALTLQAAINAHTSLPALQSTELDELAAFIQQAEPQDTADMIDSDADGMLDFQDPAPGNSCIPSAFVVVCGQDTDGDGVTDYDETETADSDGDGTADYLESSVADADADGVTDQNDAFNADACQPSAFNTNCAQDTDGDGASDFTETLAADSDGDGTADYLESSVTDADSDGVTDQNDIANADACLPSAFNSNCAQDTDGDGATDFTET